MEDIAPNCPLLKSKKGYVENIARNCLFALPDPFIMSYRYDE